MSSESHLLCQNCGSSIASRNLTRPSPVPHLLRTNQPASEMEASSIKQVVVEAKSAQDCLTRQVAQLQTTIDTLCNQKETIDEYIREHEAILAPARRILPEILSEIFLWCFADGALASAADAPVVLGQVCRYWRSVAISTPKLWSSLDLRLSRTNVEFKAELACTAFSRSGACPLDINLVLDSDIFDLDDQVVFWKEHLDSCLDAVLSRSRCWKSLCVAAVPQLLHKLSSIKDALPLLEHLNPLEIDYPKESDVVLDAFMIAPRLRSLEAQRPPSLLIVPYEQLEHLSLGWLSHAACLDWLRRCPNLVECEIDVYDLGDSVVHSSFTAHLPRLAKLHITVPDEDNLETLFDGLVTPIVNDLSIEHNEFAPWVQASFISFLHRSACAVRKLHLIGIQMTDAQLIECLRMVPSLVELTIRYYENDHSDRLRAPPPSLTNNLLKQLICQPSNHQMPPPLCPRLQVIVSRGYLNVDGGILGDLIASRWRPCVDGLGIVDDPAYSVASLKSVTLEVRQDLDARTSARLERFKNQVLE